MEPKAALLCSRPGLGNQQDLWKTLIFRVTAGQGKADLIFLPPLKSSSIFLWSGQVPLRTGWHHTNAIRCLPAW